MSNLQYVALAMKKNYKPLDRRHSKAFLFNYEKMDIEEYWRAANHELDEADASLGLSGSSTSEPIPRQYKKSFDREYAKELNTVDITGLSDSEMAEIADENAAGSAVAELCMDLEQDNTASARGREVLENALGNSEVHGSVDASVDYEYDSTSGLSRGSMCNSMYVDRKVGSQEALPSSSSVRESCVDTGSNDSSNNISITKKTIKTTNVSENNKTTEKAEMKTLRQLRAKSKAGKARKEAVESRQAKAESSKNMVHDGKAQMQKPARRRATVFENDSFQVAVYKPEKAAKKSRKSRPSKLTLKSSQDVIGVDDTRCFVSEKSDYKKILAFENLESGVLFLRKGAQIQNEKTEQNMVVCVLKGRAKVEVNDTSFMLGTGALLVIRRGWTYSVVAMSNNGTIINFVFSE